MPTATVPSGSVFNVINTTNALASYVAGECTWFIAKTLSWVPGGLGDAKDWWTRAGKATYRGTTTPIQRGHAPVVGDVAVFGPGQQAAGSHGHVAIVTKVNPDWTFNVSEMHFPGLFQQTTRTGLNPRDVLGFLASPGNATQQTAFGSSVPDDSRQTIADTYFKAGWQNDGIAGTQGAYTGPTGVTVAGFDFASLQKILTFITDPREWWRIVLVVVATVLIFIGVTGYFGRGMKVAPIPI